MSTPTKATSAKTDAVSSPTSPVFSGFPKLLKDPKFSDIKIHVGRQPTTVPFKLHRALLCERSTYFDRMLNSQFLESRSESVELPGLQPGIFDLVVRFMYTGEYTFDATKVFAAQELADVYEAADYLDVPDLKKHLMDVIWARLDAPEKLDLTFVVAVLGVLAKTYCEVETLAKVVQNLLERESLGTWMARAAFKELLDKYGIIGRLILENSKLPGVKPPPKGWGREFRPKAYCGLCRAKTSEQTAISPSSQSATEAKATANTALRINNGRCDSDAVTNRAVDAAKGIRIDADRQPVNVDAAAEFQREMTADLSFSGFPKLLNSPSFTDLTIHVGLPAQRYRVHRAIVCERSTYFAAACISAFRESHTHEIHLPDQDANTFSILLVYLYTGAFKEASHDIQTIANILVEADYLGITSLRDLLLQQIWGHLNRTVSMRRANEESTAAGSTRGTGDRILTAEYLCMLLTTLHKISYSEKKLQLILQQFLKAGNLGTWLRDKAFQDMLDGDGSLARLVLVAHVADGEDETAKMSAVSEAVRKKIHCKGCGKKVASLKNEDGKTAVVLSCRHWAYI
ncbi:hypothetical protein Dda_8636 [Drechslerella dactyloides]|uniref:BTB domain-containing protein n=1 Tax=Drechslerella dactyloides TaxID=74499 RepID=A0AAD6IQS4_DREDA|nr:hypothetical protein Dda_8636 [Drechslerella dactyloides]